VQAHPPGTAYRLKKFVRRNREAVLVATAFVLLLAGGATAATIGWVRAVAAERRAVTAADSRGRILAFLDEDLLGDVQAGDAKRDPEEFKRTLVRAAGKSGDRFRDDASGEAFVRSVIGRALYNLGAIPSRGGSTSGCTRSGKRTRPMARSPSKRPFGLQTSV